MALNRRDFLKLSGSVAGLSLAGCVEETVIKPEPAPELTSGVVIIGGGFAGIAAAKQLRRHAPKLKITLIEANPRYIAAPGMRWVLSGQRSQDSITYQYNHLREYGIDFVLDRAQAIDPVAKTVSTEGGKSFPYDRLIVSPGIEFDFTAIEGLTPEISRTRFPHAWRADGQIDLLFQQIQAMPSRGRVLISVPPRPFSAVDAPYERASLIAHYLQQHKPKAEIVLLDANEDFPKQALFEASWKKDYRRRGYRRRSMITRHGGANLGTVRSVDPNTQVVMTDSEEFKADVLNLIPPQRAGKIAVTAGLTDASGWCPVNPRTWESTLIANVHVLGDAAYPGAPFPKTAFAANSAAKSCAQAIIALLNQRTPPEPIWINTSYSLLSPKHGVSEATVYRLDAQGRLVAMPDAGGLSDPKGKLALEAVYAESWYNNLIHETFQ